MTEYEELGHCRRSGEMIVDDGIQYWNQSARKPAREEEHEELQKCQQTFRDARRADDIGKDRYNDLMVTTEKGRLILGAADYDQRGPAGTIASQYDPELLEALITLSEFRQYDVFEADSETLQRQIEAEDEQLVGFIRDEVTPQLEALDEVLSPDSGGSTTTQMQAVAELTGPRLDRLHEAVGLYIRYNGIRNVLDDIEETVLDAAKAADRRSRIADEVAQRVEESLDEFSQSLHKSLRDERREITDELHRLTYDSGADSGQRDFDRIIDKIDTLLERQKEHQESLENEIETYRTKLEGIDSDIDDLEQSLSEDEIDDQYEQLLADELEQLRDQRAAIAQQVSKLQAERAELEAAREEFETDRSALERGDIPNNEQVSSTEVKATDARIAEFDYTSRFETAVHESTGITLPDGETFTADPSYWDDHHFRNDRRRQVREYLSEYHDEIDVDTALGQYPLGRRSRFNIVESGRLPLATTPRIALEVRVQPHLKRFVQYGADNLFATEADLLEVVNDVVSRAESQDTHHLVAVASPTGWTDAAKEAVTRENGVSFSPQVDLILVDPLEQELWYDETNQLLTANIDLFEFASKEEQVYGCAEEIRDRYVGEVEYVKLETVVADTEYDRSVVALAFARLEEQNHGRRRQRHDGLYLDLQS